MLKKFNNKNIAILCLFIAIQLLVICGIFYYPETLHSIIIKDYFGFIISVIFAFGMFKPTLQIIKTIQKKTANDVAMLYYLAFYTFLVFAMIDSFIMWQVSGNAIPIKTTMANSVKMLLYLITFATVFYVRYFYQNKNQSK